MNVEQIKNIANTEIINALATCGVDNIFTVVAGGELDRIENEYISFDYEVIFSYGNVKINHNLQIGWSDKDGVGLEYGDTGEIYPITFGSVMQALYFDTALKGLDDKYH